MAVRLAVLERRRRGRNRRRLEVRYGDGRGKHLGYTTDLGERGLFLQGNYLYSPGTELILEIDHPEGAIQVRGVVRWAKEVPPAFRRSLRGGMGIELFPEE
jgi:PilZ domain-containing protein